MNFLIILFVLFGTIIFPSFASKFGEINSSTVITRAINISGENLRNGVTAPSSNLRGTTPSVPVLTFANTNELASATINMPTNWNNGDVTLIIDWALNTGETNADTLDVTIDYVAWQLPPGSSSILKTSTQVTGQITATTANGLASGDMYRMSITILAADATNPLASAVSIALELHLTNTTGVGSADILGALIQYEGTY